MFLLQDLLGTASGALVGFSLGLVGGGGSILAVPLVLYVVGAPSPHVAIGTSAVAVALSAGANLANHARRGTVKWPCATVFTLAGIAGASIGSSLGKAIDGQRLILLFSLLMVAVGLLMLRNRDRTGDPAVSLNKTNLSGLLAVGFAAGALAGFFGIGGGFLIVPGLILATGMPMINAVGSSLVAVTGFGITTAANYAWSGLIDWRITATFLVGGVIGGLAGARLSQTLAQRRGALTSLFAAFILLVAGYTAWRSINAL